MWVFPTNSCDLSNWGTAPNVNPAPSTINQFFHSFSITRAPHRNVPQRNLWFFRGVPRCHSPPQTHRQYMKLRAIFALFLHETRHFWKGSWTNSLCKNETQFKIQLRTDCPYESIWQHFTRFQLGSQIPINFTSEILPNIFKRNIYTRKCRNTYPKNIGSRLPSKISRVLMTFP